MLPDRNRFFFRSFKIVVHFDFPDQNNTPRNAEKTN